MKIAYIWIEKYYCIEKQGFNFGDKYIFDYDHKTHQLTRKDNLDYIDDFYKSKDNSNNFHVTSIIGKNGDGKSTILRYFLDNLVKGVNVIPARSFVIYFHESKYFIYHHEEVEIVTDIDKYSQFPIFLNENSPENSSYVTIRQPVVIYYSNTFNHNIREENEYAGSFNLSTDYLLRKDRENTFMTYPDNTDRLIIHSNLEKDRQINFFRKCWQDTALSDFSIKKITIPDRIDILVFTQNIDKKYEILLENCPIINEVRSYGKDIGSNYDGDSGKKNLYRFQIYDAAFWSFVYYILTHNKFDNVQTSLYLKDTAFEGEDIFGKIRSFLINIQPNLFKNVDNIVVPNQNAITMTNGIINLLDYFDTYLLDIAVRINHPLLVANKYLLSLNFLDENQPEFKLWNDFYDLYKQTTILTSYLQFYFHDISSGEKAMLSMFSRFFSISGNEPFGDDVKIKDKDLIILLDEPDLYFHPEWQRTLLHDLSMFLKHIFKNNNIHLIIASNSPFITADVPLTNVIFLGEDKDKTANHPQTFASNIHTLFKDDFYLASSFGAIAEQKIKQIFERLNQSEVIGADEYNSLSKLINIIGEPVLKRKLKQFLEEKLSDELLIKSYEEKIQELKSRQKND